MSFNDIERAYLALARGGEGKRGAGGGEQELAISPMTS